VAAVAIKDKQLVCPCCTSLSMPMEVLYPLKAKFISRPAVVANSDSPVRWEALILASLVELSL
jgi:hypothetical protein